MNDILAAWRSGKRIQYFVLHSYDSEWTDYYQENEPDMNSTRLIWRVAPPKSNAGFNNQVAKQPSVPEGYVLVSIDALRAWGVHDQVRDACQYPVVQQHKERNYEHRT
jgi:hypothetical protein